MGPKHLQLFSSPLCANNYRLHRKMRKHVILATSQPHELPAIRRGGSRRNEKENPISVLKEQMASYVRKANQVALSFGAG